MLAPKLRFKEFNDEWKKVKIKEIAEVIGGGTPSTEKDCFWNGDIQWFTPSEVGKSKYVNNSQRTISREGLKNSSAKLLPTGTILLTSRATIGEASILLHPAATNQGFQSLVPKQYMNNEFIYYLINKIEKEMKTKAFGSTFLEISKTNLENINVYTTNNNEQSKIAKFLNLLDKKIELQQRKIEVLKMYKRGLSNKLFNQKANSMFKECFLHMGGTALEKYVNSTGKYKFISIGNYSSDGTYVDNNQRIDNIATTTDKILDKDNLVMVLNDKTSQGNIIGSTILIDKDDLYIYNQRSERIICNNKIIPLYAWCILNSPNFRATIFKKSQGGTQIYINFSEIEKLKLYIPNIKEQDKLSQIYISIVKKIDLEIAYFDNLKLLKKSLLQQMFI